MRKELKMPANCIRLSQTEQDVVEGGRGLLSGMLYTLSLLFQPRRSVPETLDPTPILLQREHGDIVKGRYGVYTYADGYRYEEPLKTIDRSGVLHRAGKFFERFGL